jgi:hypothetical protein
MKCVAFTVYSLRSGFMLKNIISIAIIHNQGEIGKKTCLLQKNRLACNISSYVRRNFGTAIREVEQIQTL